MRNKKILVCVAHRDDETIGCGATIYNHHLKGDKVFLFVYDRWCFCSVKYKGNK